MGNCFARQYKKKRGGPLNRASTAKVIHTNGTLLEFERPVKASLVLSQHPSFFICSSESMYVGCYMPQMPDEEELQLGGLYFLMPQSKSRSPLSLQELCALAVKIRVCTSCKRSVSQEINSNTKEIKICDSHWWYPIVSGSCQAQFGEYICELG